METVEILAELLKNNRISLQAYKTYKGQIRHGDEAACIIGLKRKHLINDKGEIENGENNIATRSGRKNT